MSACALARSCRVAFNLAQNGHPAGLGLLRAQQEPERSRGKLMADGRKPIRRGVTENDDQGRSCVLFDSAAPNVNPGAINRGTCMTDIWVYKTAPPLLPRGR